MTLTSLLSIFPSLLLLFLFFPTCLLALSSSVPDVSWKDAAIQAANVLKDAQSVLFVTGAGISAESGLPTYRGVSGLYNDGGLALKEEGMSIEECLSASVFAQNPKVTWKYLMQIEQACRGAQPSAAHELLARAQEHIPRVAVFTQNVDGLHTRAGSNNVLSLHGNLHQLVCTKCGTTRTVETFASLEHAPIPPKCKTCGGTVRPAVVLFDEYLGDDTVKTYEQELGMSMTNLMWNWGADRPLEERPFDVSISIGTSALFAYVNAAALSGKTTIEINPCRTNLSSMVNVQVSAGATEALEFIYQQLKWDT